MEPQQEWSEAEHFVWDKICAGEEADFNSREKQGLDPKSPHGWDDSRRISSEFLETILFEKPFREVVTRKGVRILGAYFPEKIDLEDGHLPWLLGLQYSRFGNGLNMSGLQAERQVSLEGSFVKEQLNLASVSIGDALFMRGATFEKVMLRGAQIEGQLSMKSATVKGTLHLAAASIGSDLLMGGATFEEVRLQGTQIKGQLCMISARVKGKLIMDSVSIGRDLLMRYGCFANVNLDGATIGSTLNLEGGTFGKLELRGATVGRELLLIPGNKPVTWRSDDGAQSNDIWLNLQNTQVGALVDSPESWPDKIELRGFTYRQLGGPTQEDEPSERPADVFTKWLSCSKTFSLQPYQQLASVLRSAGKSGTADAVLFAARKHERRNTEVWGKWLWLSVLQYVIGYGIGLRTFWALGWALGFVFFGWGVLCLTGEDRKHEWTVGRIGLGFSLDYLLPIVQLREDHYKKVELTSCLASVYFYYIHQLIGYVLVFFVIAALTGITQPSSGRGPPG